MSAQTIKVLVTGALFFHGVAHGVAFFNLLIYGPGYSSASGLPVQSWLFPTLAAPIATAVASIIWGVAAIGFIAAALSFWGVLVSGVMWRQLALVATFISIFGIVLFSGIWPGSSSFGLSVFHIFIALTMNIIVLVSQLWLHWPSVAMFGK